MIALRQPGNGPGSSQGETYVEWPIDTSAFSFMGSLPPEPLLDHKTKHQKTGVNGKPLYSMELMCFWEEGAELLTVSFPGAPPVGLKPGMPVKVTSLSLSHCSVDARYGLTFRAAKVEPLGVAGHEGGLA
jgi:hypothetical protein